MALSDSLIDLITPFLKTKFSPHLKIIGFQEISGGCINQGGSLVTTEGSFFLKWNSVQKFPGMFDAEAVGLNLIASTRSIQVPEIIGILEDEVHQVIIMRLIDNDVLSKNFWQQFGTGLAHLHATRNDYFGLTNHNYIGSLRQWNDPHNNWIDFFIEKRLSVQLQLAVDGGFDLALRNKFDALFQKLPQLLTIEKPSLLHGDLWRGNLITSNGSPCLIDPAVYYGHREVDLAMTQLFGGFDENFITSYEDVLPLENGWRDRLNLYKLYPLLVHLNLFGRSYLPQIVNILKRYE